MKFRLGTGLWISITIMAVSTAFALGQEVSLPEGEGKKILENSCTLCHDLTMVTKNHLNKDGWEATIGLMIDMGADLTKEQIPILVEYLTKNFGPENTSQ